MERKEFMNSVREALSRIPEKTLSYDESEFWMYGNQYELAEFYAVENRYINTAIALPLVRGLHDGVHRKFSVIKDGVSYRMPYIIHPLRVCIMLMELHVPLTPGEEDIMLAAALCHDLIEDIPFENHGTEMYEKLGLDKRVYETVKRLSKRPDFTPEEERMHFRAMEEDKLALLIKLADRGNNVEDMYNMSLAKIHEYVGETRTLILPMCGYAAMHYPEQYAACELLRNKIECLTETAEVLAERYERKEQKLRKQVLQLREENELLRRRWKTLWEA